MNTKVVIRETLVNEIMRLAGLLATARVRRHVVNAGLQGDSGETKEGVQQRVEKAETHLRDYAKGLAELPTDTDPCAALSRKQELIADLAFNLGHFWRMMDSHLQTTIMDSIGGSRGLMQKVIEWADEFDVFWENLEDQEDYIEKIDDFSRDKFDALITEHGE